MAEPLVVVPGLMADARQWMPQIVRLSRERSVLVAPPTRGERMEEIASMLLDELPARFALVGNCFGAMVAMEILRRAPERVNRLALVGTTPLADTPQQAAAREPQIVALRTGRLDEILRETLPARALADGPERGPVWARMSEMARELGPEIFVAQMRAMQRRRDQQSTLRKCRVPTLILCGAEDELTPVKRHAFMAELMPAATLSVVEGAGHLPMMEKPDDVTAALHGWLAAPLVLR